MATYYWVGGAGTWNASSTTNWSATSGGAGGAGFPTSADNVIFDANSGAGIISYNGAVCNNFDASTSSALTPLGGGAWLSVYGNYTMGGSFNAGLGTQVYFRSTTTGKTITSNGKTTAQYLFFQGVGGGWTLQDALTVTATITLTNGSLNTNGQTVTCPDNFYSNGTDTRSLILGSSTLNIGGGNSLWLNSTGLTFNAGTSTINLTHGTSSALRADGQTFYNVQKLNAGSSQVYSIVGSNQFTNLTITGNGYFNFGGNQVITGTLTATGTSTSSRAFLISSVAGTQRSITAAAVSLSNADIKDINAVTAFTAPFGVGNLGNNTGITFNSSTAYWIGGTGNINDGTKWSLSSGGSAANAIPQSTNSVVFDAGSDAGSAFAVSWNATISVNNYTVNNLDFAMSVSGASPLYVYGNWFTPATNYSRGNDGTVVFAATTTGKTITTNGVQPAVATIWNGVGGEWTLQDNFTCPYNICQLNAGTLNTNGKTVTLNEFYLQTTGTKSLVLGASTLSLGNFLYTGSNLTVTPGTSTINMTGGNFNAPGLTFNTVNFTYISGASSSAGIVSTITGNITFGNLSIKAPTSGIQVTELTGNVTVTGTFSTASPNTVRDRTVIRSTATGTKRTLKIAAASLSNMDFKDIAIDPTSVAYPLTGTSLGDAGNNTGITFTTAKTVYWNLAGTTSWVTSVGWATTNTGTPAVGNFPLPQDTAVFTEAGAAGTINFGTESRGLQLPTITCADGTSNRVTAFTFAFGGASSWYFNGNFTGFANLIVTVGGSNGFVFQKQGTLTFTSNGCLTGSITPSVVSGCTFTLGDNCTFAETAINDAGTIFLNEKTLTNVATINIFRMFGTTPVLNFGTNGILRFTGAGSIFSEISATASFTGTGQILIAAQSGAVTFNGNSRTYGKLTLGEGTNSTAQVTITGSNTFGEISSNAFGGTLLLTASTTQTVTNFTYGGYKDTLYNIAGGFLTSTTTTAANLVKSGGGTINANYLKVSYVNVTPSNTWNALNSLSVIGTNTGWTFSGYPGNYGYTDAGNPIENKYVTKDYVMDYYPDLIPSMKQPQGYGIGYNGYGSLGDGTTTNKSVLTTVLGTGQWKQLNINFRSSAGIKTDGTLWTWGENAYGQLGDGSGTQRTSPVTTAGGGTNWKQVWIRERQTSGIKTDGTLWTWGYNNVGQLGDATTSSRTSPVTTAGGGTNWKQVSVGSDAMHAVKTDGTLWSWGSNANGQLGDGTTSSRTSPVTTIGGGTNWKQVSAGFSFVCAIKTDGTLWSWGIGSSGQLGDGTTSSRTSPITTAGGTSNWKQVSCGVATVAGIKTDGTLWTWGSNGNGELATGNTTARSSPGTTAGGGSNWKQVVCSSNSAAIKTDGTLWVWGVNSYGNLNDGTSSNRSSPIQTVSGGTNWKQVYTGLASMSVISEAQGW